LLVTRKFLQNWVASALPAYTQSDRYTPIMVGKRKLVVQTLYPPLISYHAKVSDVNALDIQKQFQIGMPDLECMHALHASGYEYTKVDCLPRSENRGLNQDGSYWEMARPTEQYEDSERSSKALLRSVLSRHASTANLLATPQGRTWRLRILSIRASAHRAVASAATDSSPSGISPKPVRCENIYSGTYTFFSNGTLAYNAMDLDRHNGTHRDGRPCTPLPAWQPGSIMAPQQWGNGAFRFNINTNSSPATLVLHHDGAEPIYRRIDYIQGSMMGLSSPTVSSDGATLGYVLYADDITHPPGSRVMNLSMNLS